MGRWRRRMKCKQCGKEFEPKQGNQKFCSEDCRVKVNVAQIKMTAKIKAIAKKFDFDLKNKDKIIRAKMMLFNANDVHRCPCDADNPKRFCGSALCIHDVVHYGHCHCNLFHLKDSPIEPTME